MLNIETHRYKNIKDMDDDGYLKGRLYKGQIRIIIEDTTRIRSMKNKDMTMCTE